MNTINFSDLPFLAQKRILELGDPALRLNLSYLSKRMENVVRESRTVTREMACAVKNKEHRISVRGEDRKIFVQLKGNKEEGKEEEEIVISGQYMLSRLSQFHPEVKTGSDAQLFSYYSQDISPKNSSAVMNWLLGLLRPLRLRWKFDDVTNEDVKSMMAFPPSQYANTVKIKSGELESETMSALINHVKCAETFIIQCKLPLDFHHNQPFRFPITTYKEARWVTLEHLLPMNFCQLNLGETNIGSSDLNVFLNEWISKDRETVQSLTLSELKEKVDWPAVMYGIRSLYFFHEGKPTLLISSKTDKDRVGQLGRISSDDRRKFQFKTVSESRYPGKKELLQMLNLRADLQVASDLYAMELAQLEEVEWDSEEGKERLMTIRQVDSMKTEIDRQLREVSRTLEFEGVDFSRGMAIIR